MRRTLRMNVSVGAVPFIVLALVVAAACGHSSPPPASSSSGVSSSAPSGTPSSTSSPSSLHLAHIFIIVDENKSYSEIVGSREAPTINALIGRYALASNYQALFHPSLPNYIALTSGSNQGITDDRSPPSRGNEVAATNIADRLEASGHSWKEYAESIPSPGFAFDSGLYVTKHDPFVYYKDIVGNAQRCRTHVVPFTQLAIDLKSAQTTPDFAFISPNLCNDMHDCPIATGDRWLARVVPLILSSEAFTTSRSVLVLTWDEGSLFDNRVAIILAGTPVKKGYRSARRYDHYSLLRTIEANWGLASLTSNDAKAATMDEFFN